jgi:hypothetical protein
VTTALRVTKGAKEAGMCLSSRIQAAKTCSRPEYQRLALSAGGGAKGF